MGAENQSDPLIPSSNETDGENETSACAWIETIDEDVAEGELAEAYEVCAERSSRRAAHIYKVQGLSPRAMVQHRALYRTLVFGPSPLERYQREMVGVVVSGINGCHY